MKQALGFAGRDLLMSLAILAGVVAFALAGLAFDGNWPKVARVGASFATYSCVLLGLLFANRNARPRFSWFVFAGALTGIVSGVVRPEINIVTVMAQALAGAVLLGGAHWLALSHWRRVRERIVSTTP